VCPADSSKLLLRFLSTAVRPPPLPPPPVAHPSDKPFRVRLAGRGRGFAGSGVKAGREIEGVLNLTYLVGPRVLLAASMKPFVFIIYDSELADLG
jgi:hypothetical protein